MAGAHQTLPYRPGTGQSRRRRLPKAKLGGFNPQLLEAIMGAPPHLRIPLAATAIVESNGRLDAIGDSGNSYGPYQENINGRGSHGNRSSSKNPFDSTRRAVKEFQEFYKKGARGAELAVRAQRPADYGDYRRKYNKALPRARALVQRAATGIGPGSTGAGVAQDYGQDQSVEEYLGEQPIGPRQLSPKDQTLLARWMADTREQVFTRPVGDIASVLPLLEQADWIQPTESVFQTVAQGTTGGEQGPRFVAGRQQKLTAGGGPEAHQSRALGDWQSDDAYDIMGRANQQVFTPQQLKVTKVSGKPGGDPGFAGYGVTVVDPQGNQYFYKHLNKLGPKVKVGRTIPAGGFVGTLDPTTAGGPHLHLGGTNRQALDRVYNWYLNAGR